jgi:hypothetical protein
MTFGTGILLLIVGLVVPAVTILLWKGQPATVAEVLNRVEASANSTVTRARDERRVMRTSRLLAMSLAAIVAFASQVTAYDLSRYREFQAGMSVAAVAAQAAISPEPRVVQQRPALIQELMWQPPRVFRLAPNGDAVRKVLFSFYNGQLFRMVVTYNRDRTEGLTAADLIDAISANYGHATLAPQSAPQLTAATSIPDGTATPAPWPQQSSRSLGYEDTILARWEDAENSIHLFESPFESGFGLVVVSKSLDALARVATAEATRLDSQEAPQREIERQQKQSEDKRLKNEAARRSNKAAFRP